MLSQTLTEPKLPYQQSGAHVHFDSESQASLAMVEAQRATQESLIIITPDSLTANRLVTQINFFNQQSPKARVFPGWEILPYDHFSPHQDIISERIYVLNELLKQQQHIIAVPINTLMHYLPPPNFIANQSFYFKIGEKIDINKFRQLLLQAGYYTVSEVVTHGEFAIRGGIIDVFPMGSKLPLRLELFDDEIEQIRTFNPDTQLTIEKINHISLLPAREYPLDEAGISEFRSRFRAKFTINPLDTPVYQQVSDGLSFPGIEYYLPLFFQQQHTLFDYLSDQALIVLVGNIEQSAQQFNEEINQRFEQLSGDILRPILPPSELIVTADKFAEQYEKKRWLKLSVNSNPVLSRSATNKPLSQLTQLIKEKNLKILLTSESLGHQSLLLERLAKQQLFPAEVHGWADFLAADTKLAITSTPNMSSMLLTKQHLAIINETELLETKVQQQRAYPTSEQQNSQEVIENLTELQLGSPVVHLYYGVGRYQGLTNMTIGNVEAEYLILIYADNDKIYVPVANLHLISRYSGADIENAPLHKLGSKQWEKAKQKAKEQIQDVAADLLEIYAKREAKVGFKFNEPSNDYDEFCESFPFEETPDQLSAIKAVVHDMTTKKLMDRLVCGDVGFGKTEVAMRAAFLAVQSNKQVAILVPTTLLANQHLETFIDRFANWPIKIDSLSRFKTAKQVEKIKSDLATGKLDIIIGTHRLIQTDIKFKELGLLVIDEEHRLGVQQKEKIKSMQANVDILQLTATPIPRTLNMALSAVRDLSIIATPPLRRLSIKTYVGERQDSIIREAVLREILRGGQVFYLHNRVQTITKAADELRQLIPEASIKIAHGQMSERELEHIMLDFYHQKFNLLVCTTIVESGIDIPSANTIIIDRADKFGLAQLHQLRGRVGRSHHQAYAYLLTAPKNIITKDAERRLEAIAKLKDLGAGFSLAIHDLEIRGAGEFLGEEQSGQIQAIGFNLYLELLEQAVKAIKAGKDLMHLSIEPTTCEIDIQFPALLPSTYIPDVYTRLTIYKRIANSKTDEDLRKLKIELIDRFGLLPEQTQNLFIVTELRQQVEQIGVRSIKHIGNTLTLQFNEQPAINLDALISLIQTKPKIYQMQSASSLKITLDSQDLTDIATLTMNTVQIIAKPMSSLTKAN